MTFEFEAINRDLSIDLDIEVEGISPRLDETTDERTLEVRQESFSVDFVCSDIDGRKTMSLEMGFCPSVSYRVNPDGTISIIIQSLAGEFVIDNIINSVFLAQAILASEARSLADAQMYTDRKWQDAQEAQALIAEALLKEFTNTISPVAINTMQAIFGSESLQYMFIVSEDDDTLKPHYVRIDYHRDEEVDGEQEQERVQDEEETDVIFPELICPDGVIKHYTLGIAEVRADMTVDSFMRWAIKGPNSDPDDPTTQETRLVLDDDDAAYYLYIKATREVVPPNEDTEENPEESEEDIGEDPPVGGIGTAEFIVSKTAIEWDSDETYYYFLYATIGRGGKEKDRAITYWNGFTEITPGRITAYKFVSPDGVQYLDFLTKNFRLGDAYSHLMFDHALGKLFLKGTITQSPAGDTFPTPCYRGVWIKNEEGEEPNQVAYYGDLFTYEGQSWLCIDEAAVDLESAIEDNPSESSSSWRIYAAKGESSTSELVLNLTNDSASINCDKDGHILPGAIRPTCKASLTYGIITVEGAVYSVSTPSSQQASGLSINSTTGVLSFGSNFSFEGSSLEITVRATYQTEHREAIMTVTKSYPGTDGQPAVSYWLVLSADAVKYNPNDDSPAPVPATVSASAMKQVGSGTPEAATDCSIYYGYNTQAPSTPYNGAISVDISKSYLAFVLKKGSEIVDGVEIIPILREGKDGQSGSRGKAGPMPRGLNEWDANGIGGWYQGGDRETDLYVDFVIYNDTHYRCIKSHPTSSSSPIYPTNRQYWEAANEFQFIAAKALYVDMALIENATIKNLHTSTDSNKGAVSAFTNDKTVLSVVDRYGTDVLYASDNPLSGSGSSGTVSFNIRNTYGTLPCYVQGLNVYVTIAELSNIPARAYAAIPSIRYTISNWPASLNGAIEWSVRFGSITVASGSTQQHSTLTTPAINAQLPEGNCAITIALRWVGTPDSRSITVTCPGATAQYSASGNNKNEFGTNGMQSVWGSEGVKVTSAGAKVISNGDEYAMLGGGALNSLTAPKKIVVCTSYPATEESDTLYIKVS